MCDDRINAIARILEVAKSEEITGDGSNIYASVMMILKNSGNSLDTLLIRRSTNDKDVFSGHMAFPGGKKKESDEDRIETALRETREEVGIDLSYNSVLLGKLNDCNPSTPAARKFIVRPYISYLKEDAPLTINEEVSEAVWIPLADLKNIYLDNYNKYKGEFIKENFEYRYEHYFIWGLTGRILNNFFDLTNQLLD